MENITALKDITIHENNETDNRMRGLQKLLTFEFYFAMEVYLKYIATYCFFSLDKQVETIT